MSTSFSNRITQLRKERGLSQKEVALNLGVSQALLSHYEKGVRECGLDFVVRCADYFDVTTDYLLGRQESKYGSLNNTDSLPAAKKPEEKINMQTVLKCVNYLAEKFNMVDGNADNKMLWILAIVAYKVIISGIKSGKIKEDSLRVTSKSGDILFSRVTDAVYCSLFEGSPSASVAADKSFFSLCDQIICNVENYVEKAAGTLADR